MSVMSVCVNTKAEPDQPAQANAVLPRRLADASSFSRARGFPLSTVFPRHETDACEAGMVHNATWLPTVRAQVSQPNQKKSFVLRFTIACRRAPVPSGASKAVTRDTGAACAGVADSVCLCRCLAISAG